MVFRAIIFRATRKSVLKVTRKSMPQFQGPITEMLNPLIGSIFWNKNILKITQERLKRDSGRT